MTGKLSQAVMDDLAKALLERTRDATGSVLQLVDDPTQVIHLLMLVSVAAAHDAAHIMHDTRSDTTLAECWSNVTNSLCKATCPAIRKSQEEAARRKQR